MRRAALVAVLAGLLGAGGFAAWGPAAGPIASAAPPASPADVEVRATVSGADLVRRFAPTPLATVAAFDEGFTVADFRLGTTLWSIIDNQRDDLDRGWAGGVDGASSPLFGALLAGRKTAWPAAGGLNAVASVPRIYPPNLFTWAIVGPFNAQDALEFTYSTDFVVDVDPAVVNNGPAGIVEGFFRGCSADGATFIGAISARRSTGAALESESRTCLDRLAVNGIVAPPLVYFGLMFKSSPVQKAYEGVYVDRFQIIKETKPAAGVVVSRVHAPALAKGASLAPQGVSTDPTGVGFVNGGFENGLTGWLRFGEQPTSAAMGGVGPSMAGVLGDPAKKCNGEVAANSVAALGQIVTVPNTANPQLTLTYRILTSDRAARTQQELASLLNYGDSFDVRVRPPDTRTLVDSVDGALVGTVVLRDGNVDTPVDTEACGSQAYLVDAGVRTRTVSLAAFKGQTVLIALEQWNRPDRVLPTLVHVDDVAIIG